MTKTLEPEAAVRAVLAGVSRLRASDLCPDEREMQLDALADLYAETTDVRHPFAPPGTPPLRTRAELRAHFAAGIDRTAGATGYAPAGILFHHTADAEVVVVEFRYVGTVHGRPFELPCIFVVRVRDGVIIESRDYGNYLAYARAFGRLEELEAMFTEDTPVINETSPAQR